jgi:hypothetical protein
MKKFSLILVILALTSLTFADAYQDGGDRLTALQNNDGGWDWPLDDGNPANTSPVNTIGPIGMGLAKAYANTGDASHLATLQAAGSLLLSKTNNFSPSDGYLAVELDNVFGGTTYSSHLMDNFYTPLANGTYDKNGAGTLFSTADYVNGVRNYRSGTSANLAAWDTGMGLYAASVIGADTTYWVIGVTNEIDELDGSAYYDVIGLAGALMGLSAAGADFDPTAGEHAAATSLSDLAAILSGYQLSTGGFAWNSDYVIENDYNEAIQESAYAVLALSEFDSATYWSNILAGADYIQGVQLGTGGWENYAGSGENNEITGEALWALTTVPEPATLALLGLGGLLLRKRK